MYDDYVHCLAAAVTRKPFFMRITRWAVNGFGALDWRLSTTHVTLIPKVKDAFRLITRGNKLLSRFLDRLIRLKGVLDAVKKVHKGPSYRVDR